MKDWFKARNVWGAAFLSLSDEEAGQLVKALWSYTMTGKEPDLPSTLVGSFAIFKMMLDQDDNKELEISSKRSEAGRKGGMQRPKKQNEANQANAYFASGNKQTEANADNKNQNQNQKYIDDEDDDEDNYSAGAREEETEWKSAVETAVEAQCGRKAAPAEIAQIATRAQLFGLSPGMVALAIKTAAENHALNLVKYVTKIFDDWQFEHVTTPEEAEELTAMRFAAKGQGLYVVDSHEDVDRMREARERRKAEHESKAGVG